MGSRIDGIQTLTETALGEMVQTIERHEVTLVEHDEAARRMDRQLAQQEAMMEQLRQDVASLHSA